MFKQARCMWMRGGTSKGGYFPADDLPADTAERDAFLLRAMGSPDLRQIDGMGGALMNLGDVAEKSIPKMTMVSSARQGGAIATRTFIPHRCHKAIGVLGAVSVATACLLRGGPAHQLADTGSGLERRLSIEHPTGEMTVVASINAAGEVERAAILRTARKLKDGTLYA